MIPLFAAARIAGAAVMTIAGAKTIHSRRRRVSDSDVHEDHPQDPPTPGGDEPWDPTSDERSDPTGIDAMHPADRVAAAADGVSGSWLDLSGRDLRRADLSEFDFVCADLRRARLSGRRLVGRDLTGALMTGADLDRAILIDAQLAGADLSWASLRRADLSGADLDGASLVETDLKGADLSGADLRGARNLASAVLRGAHASRTTLWPSNFEPILAGVIVHRP
ncbi:MAG: pentapeptide repeat-containing protein [Acidimicrobiales bacterium]